MSARPSRRPRSPAVIAFLLAVGAAWPTIAAGPVAAADPSHGFLQAEGSGGAKIAAAVVPPVATTGFADKAVIQGLTNPTAIRFASDGRIFVAEKSGIIKVFDSLSDTTPTIFADLTANVDNFWDRGLLGMTLDPNFASNGNVYVLYALDAPIGGTTPTWNDACPDPPGATTDGCVIGGRLSRLSSSGGVSTGETTLVEGWCQQFPSHSIGDLRFGPNGELYATGGDGASFTGIDYGALGGSSGSPTPRNPCGDPPAGSNPLTPPTARGGALRSQSVRRPAGEPVLLNGSLIRINPATGAGMSTNPMASSSDANARRIVGYGMRNPYRFTVRPNSNEVWVGDVGFNDWEEIDRIANPLSSTVANLGWPCYEGVGQQPIYQAANLDMCTSLYAAPTGLLTPYYTYSHDALVVPGETCPKGSSVVSGMAFSAPGSYPADYTGALFFADYARKCIWAMKAGGNGLPDPTNIVTFVAGAANPVALETGPNGDLFYVDFDGGTIHEVSVTAANANPTAVIAANPTSGRSPLVVAFDGTGSTDPEGGALSYAWDLDGDGQFDDSTSATPTFTYPTTGTRTVGLKVTDPAGKTGTATTPIVVDDSLPLPVIDTPLASLTWKVGDPIAFSGHATDGQGAALPASALSWTLLIHHCPSNCHTHNVQNWVGTASGSFPAPDHDFPSWLELILTATDSQSRTATTSVRLDPRTVDLTFGTVPAGLDLVVGTQSEAPGPFTRTVIVNSVQGVSAPTPQTIGTTSYSFTSWSDGGAATHTIVAPAAPATYTATYTAAATTTSYLSDLAYTVAANGWGPAEKDRSNGEQAAGDGGPLTLAGVVYAKGLGVHAVSDIRYTMSNCSLFAAKVGIDDESGNAGSVNFQVFGDGTKLYDSGVLTGASATATVSVNVSGKTALQLMVTNGGDNLNSDHADWADAKLTCGPGTPPDTTPPTVTSTVPAAGATGVATSSAVTATFSEAINAATVSTSTVTLAQGSTAIAGTVTYNAGTLTATLTPSAALSPSTVYTATVKGGGSGVKDVAGNALATDKVWTFTTAAGADTTPPTVTSTVPAAGATGVATSSAVTATFSEAINAATVSTSTVTLAQGSTAIAGTVTYNAGTLTATLTPSAALSPSTVYTATVKGGGSGVKDVAGNALATDKVWTFTTAASGATTSYLSDLAYTVAANGWGPAEKDRSNGEQAAGDGGPLTLAGVVYAKGLGVHAVSDIRYTMSNCSLFAAKVGIDDESGNAGSVNFQVFGDGTKLYDSGVLTGASATATVSVNVSGKTALQLMVTNGGDNLNSDHADWADAKLTCGPGTPPDTTPPTVTSTVPAAGATGVATSSAVTATFSEAINAATVSTSTVTLAQGSTAIAGTVTYNAGTLTATLTPSAALSPSTVYTATVKGGGSGVKDVAGNALATDKVWTFTTAAGADTTPPTVTSTVPAAGATGVATSSAVTATFSEAINAATVSTSTVTLAQGSTAIAGTVTYNAGTLTATLTPSAALSPSTVYTATVKGGGSGVKDVAGNALATDKVWTFTTAASGATTSYLSDLAYTVAANGWGPAEKDRSNGEQAAGDGGPLTLAGVVYAKGLGVHAVSDIRYTMSNCSLFAAKVGIDDESGNAGSVNFQVFGDGTKLYDSGVLTGASATATVSVNVSGKTALQLMVTNGGDNLNSDHADWADAKLTCG